MKIKMLLMRIIFTSLFVGLGMLLTIAAESAEAADSPMSTPNVCRYRPNIPSWYGPWPECDWTSSQPSIPRVRKMSTLTIQNDSAIDICHIQIIPYKSGVWGRDWLTGSEILRSGDEKVLRMPQGIYDMLMTDCDLNRVAGYNDFQFWRDSVWRFDLQYR